MRIAIIGGTGALGGGIAERLARTGNSVLVGSRSEERAVETAERLSIATGSDVVGASYEAVAAAADIVFVCVPYEHLSETLHQIARAVRGKIVVDTTVPLRPPKVARVQLPEAGSAAAVAASCLDPDTRLVTSFHTVSAKKLRDAGMLESDILVFGDDVDARQTIIDLIALAGMRGIHGGPLDNAVAAEAMTSVLISINRRYKVAEGAGIKIVGLDSARS